MNINDLLTAFLLRLNEKGLIDNHTFEYEAEIRHFLKTNESKKITNGKADKSKKANIRVKHSS
jgi:hypothetical protein